MLGNVVSTSLLNSRYHLHGPLNDISLPKMIDLNRAKVMFAWRPVQLFLAHIGARTGCVKVQWKCMI